MKRNLIPNQVQSKLDQFERQVARLDPTSQQGAGRHHQRA